MPNYIVTYDLNGNKPTHKEVDDLLDKLGAARARILETVWYVGYTGTAANLLNQLKTIMSSNDLVLVVEANNATWTKLLVDGDWIAAQWSKN